MMLVSRGQRECPEFIVRYVRQRLEQMTATIAKDTRSWLLRLLVRPLVPIAPHAVEVVELSEYHGLERIGNEHVLAAWWVCPSFVKHQNGGSPQTPESSDIKEMVPLPVILFFFRSGGSRCVLIEVAPDGTSTTMEFTLPNGLLSEEVGPQYGEALTERLNRKHPWHPFQRLLNELENPNHHHGV